MAFPSKPVTRLYGSNGPVHALSYSSTPSTYILTGSSDRSIRLYNPSRPASTPAHVPPQPTQLIQTYSTHAHEILSLCISSTNATFLSSGGDRTVFHWDVSTAQTIRRFHGHTSRVNSVTYGGEGESVAVSGGNDMRVRIWDLRSNSGKEVMVFEEAGDAVTDVVVSGWEIGSASVDGRVRWYDMRIGRVESDVIGTSVTSLTRTRDGRGYLVGGLDSSIRLMDRESGGLLKSYKDPGFMNQEFRMRSIFGGNEKWVVSGNEDVKGKDGGVVVWDTLTGGVVERIKVLGNEGEVKKKIGRDGTEVQRRNVVSCLAWKEDGRGDQWCCAGTDGVVTVFGQT